MHSSLLALEWLLLAFAGRINEHHLGVIDYLMEENRVLRELRGKKQLRLTDEQRRRRAVKAKRLGRSLLNEVATMVTPADSACDGGGELVCRERLGGMLKYDSRRAA